MTLRKAIVGALRDIPGIRNGPTWRPARVPTKLPALTFSDTDLHNPSVPLLTRDTEVSLWGQSEEELAPIADIVRQRMTGSFVAPLALPQYNVHYLRLETERDEVIENSDVVRRVLLFRCLAYRLAA
jgi:hypothetical protein